MKRIIIVSFFLLLLSEVNAQPNYDVEIDGLCYSLNLNEFNAKLVHVQSSVSNVDVPSSITVSGRVFTVNSIDLRFGQYNYHYISTVSIPNTIVYLQLGMVSEQQGDLNNYPVISSIMIPSSVEIISSISHMQITSLVIPLTVQEVRHINHLPLLSDLIIEDGDEELEWGSGHGQFEGMTSLINVYLGRQINGNFGGIGTNIRPEKCVIGPTVYQASYNLFPYEVIIPNTVKIGYLGESGWNSTIYPNSVVFEDGVDYWEASDGTHHIFYDRFAWTKVSNWYIGRPGVWIPGVRGEQLTFGPMLKSQQVSDCIKNHHPNYLPPWTVKGEGSYVKLFQFLPPEIHEEDLSPFDKTLFDNETCMNTPLYVPRGSKQQYEQAFCWGNFFNIIEFDWESPYFVVSAMSNDNSLGSVEGRGEYSYGEMATLTANVLYIHNGFINWTENGEVVSTDRVYTFRVERNRNLVANFRPGSGVDEDEENSTISIFVNNRTIMIEGANTTSNIAVYNMQGQCVYNGRENKIPVSTSGLYVVTIENNKTTVVVE